MVRSCQQHIEYTGDDGVQCAVRGGVSLTDCSRCDQFVLKPYVKPDRPTGKTTSRKPHIGVIGTRLARIIERETGAKVDCAQCESEIARLNLMTSATVLGEADQIARKIVERGAVKAETWLQRMACSVAPGVVASVVAGWVREAATVFHTDRAKWSSDIRHLTYHVWPRIGSDSWLWNLDQLSTRWHLFNGIKCLGIAFDTETESPAAVIDACVSRGMQFDHVIERPNLKGLREVTTWLPMLELLSPESAGPDEVVFSAHAKGVRHKNGSKAVTWWADVMYQTCLDDWPRVEQQLKSCSATGSFKRYGEFTTEGNHRWHFSGTFFWWRLQEAGKGNWRQVDQRFFGTESWIGHQMPPGAAGCLFMDDCGDLYSQEYWNEKVTPEWLKSSWAAATSHAATGS